MFLPENLFIDSNKDIPHHFCAAQVEEAGGKEKENKML
jgi:hypothetical protein